MPSIFLLFFAFVVIAIILSAFKPQNGRTNGRKINEDINQHMFINQMMHNQVNDINGNGIPDNMERGSIDSDHDGIPDNMESGTNSFDGNTYDSGNSCDSGSSFDSNSSFDSGSSSSDSSSSDSF